MADRYAFTVDVETMYLPEQSSEEDGNYAFSYTITVTNTGTMAAQLVSRHWIIDDGNGDSQEVKGLGVVGEQPLIQPNESYQYTSGTLLTSLAGSMHGTYQMVAIDGTQFEAVIEPFTLAAPRVLH